MNRKQKLVCWFLLPAMILWLSSGIGAGRAGAFFRETTSNQSAVWDTFMQPDAGISSNCLIPGGQVILLGDVVGEQLVEIRYRTDSLDEVQFDCQLADPQMEEYVYPAITDLPQTVASEDMKVYLLIYPLDAAQNLSSDVQVDVLVTLTQGDVVLEGTFRFVLPAGEESITASSLIEIEEIDVPMAYMFMRSYLAIEDSRDAYGDTNSGPNDDPYDTGTDTEITPVPSPEPEPEQPPAEEEETGPDDDPYDIGSDTEVTPVPPPDEEPGEGGPDIPLPNPEPEQPPVEDGETKPDDPYVINPDTEITPVLPPPPPAEEPDDDPYVIDPDTEITPIPPPEAPNDDPYDITADTEITPLPVKELSSHSPQNATVGMIVPIMLDLPADCFSVKVFCVEGSMPPFTRYSPDGGLTWYLLYYGGEISVAVDELSFVYMDERCLLLDLSQSRLSGELPVEVTVQANTLEAVYEGNITLYPEMTFFGETNTSFVLENGGSMIVPQSQSSENCSNQLFLERLVLDGTSASYESISAEQINVTFYDGAIELSGDTLSLPAGTYRLTILYLYGGVILSQSQITFFVNHTVGTRWS